MVPVRMGDIDEKNWFLSGNVIETKSCRNADMNPGGEEHLQTEENCSIPKAIYCNIVLHPVITKYEDII